MAQNPAIPGGKAISYRLNGGFIRCVAYPRPARPRLEGGGRDFPARIGKHDILGLMPIAESEQSAARSELGKVLASAGFARNERLARFLRFAVEIPGSARITTPIRVVMFRSCAAPAA